MLRRSPSHLPTDHLSHRILPASRLFAFSVSPAQEKLAKVTDGKDRTGSFFIAQLSGKQHWMEVGRFYDVYRVAQEPEKQIRLHRILAHETKDGVLMIGRPYLETIRVNATVMQHFRGPKLYILKHKAKKWRKFMGHRQEMSRIRIDSLEYLGSTNSVAAAQNAHAGKDPLHSVLTRIQGKTKALQGVRRMATIATTSAPIGQVSLLPEDPLENYDPVFNEKLIESLVLGKTSVLSEN